jgi:dihydroorotate dehydrogenase
VLYPTVLSLFFAVDPERAHRLALDAIRTTGWVPGRSIKGSPVELMGLRFPNRVGLAAGYDKNAEAIDGLGKVGFGFIEVGTVTPRPQPGQPRPRLFRVPESHALINRLGFPNDGAVVIARRLRKRRYRGIVGVNIGKNADTPLDRATDDYVACLRTLHSVADYIAINISSPNTKALRELHEPDHLRSLLSALVAERDRLLRDTDRDLPLVLKISPDLAIETLTSVASVVQIAGIEGIIATNTTVQRHGQTDATLALVGGLSGAPLFDLSVATVRELRRLLGPSFPIIGVGGIDSPERAHAMREAGADLVQLYTGLIYRGPSLVPRCVRST